MQVTKHVHAIKVPFQVVDRSGMKVDRFVYVYLIYGEKVYLIDTGVASSEIEIFDYLRNTGREPEDISMLILTHSHPDHIGAARAVKEASGCTVVAHRAEIPWIEDVDLQSRDRPVPNFHSLVGGSVGIDIVIEDGDHVDLDGDLCLEVFHTPGHSKGSISLFLREEGVLFSGDAIPVAGDVPIYEDVSASVRSIEKLKAIDGIDVLLASWEDPLKGEWAYKSMDDGLDYLQRIHEAVIKVAKDDISLESMELCRRTLSELKLPDIAANPLVAKSFEANMKVRDRKDIRQI